eukprot:GSA25T00013357001.1
MRVKRYRRDLKIVVTSATLDVEAYLEYFARASLDLAKQEKQDQEKLPEDMNTKMIEDGDANSKMTRNGSGRSGVDTTREDDDDDEEQAKKDAWDKVRQAGAERRGGSGEKLKKDTNSKELEEAAPGEPASRLKYTVVTCEGRCFPVRIKYLSQPCANYIEKAVEVCEHILATDTRHYGDILIFLTGAEEVQACVEVLKDYFSEEIEQKSLQV